LMRLFFPHSGHVNFWIGIVPRIIQARSLAGIGGFHFRLILSIFSSIRFMRSRIASSRSMIIPNEIEKNHASALVIQIHLLSIFSRSSFSSFRTLSKLRSMRNIATRAKIRNAYHSASDREII
jgi:hypothetical protein